VNRYPDPNQTELKNILSKIKNIPTENILLGNGSDEVLDLIFRAFCEPGKDNIIVNPPTYGMYEVLADMNNVTCKKVSLTTDFQLDASKIIADTDVNTKVLFICSPNNPTGNLLQKEAVLELIENVNALVVIDEAYIDFTTAESWNTEINNFPNLIVTQTLSKAYGMAGIRLGICYANTEIISVLKKIKMPYNVNVLTQRKAIEILQQNKKVTEDVTDILENRTVLAEALGKIPFVEKIYASDANFLLAKVDDANTRYAQLTKKGIVVRNRTKEPLCENCLRFTVGTTSENEKLIKALKALI
jgi:histidinol-phosphate aminotransferase